MMLNLATSGHYVFSLLYSRYSLSKGSEAMVGAASFLTSSFTSGKMSAKQASPPMVSHASAGNTLTKTLCQLKPSSKFEVEPSSKKVLRIIYV